MATTHHAFDVELDALGQRLDVMSKAVVGMLEMLGSVVRQPDAALVDAVRSADQEVDAALGEIEQDVTRLIARHQPVASDLRRILAVGYAAVHIERVGDCAARAANGLAELGTSDLGEVRSQLGEMVAAVGRMLEVAVGALRGVDEGAARAVEPMDDVLDRHYRSIFERAAAQGADDGARQAVWLERVSRALERAGDHAVDIAEETIFLATGEIIDLPSSGGAG
jgi:phosphate transport system protein